MQPSLHQFFVEVGARGEGGGQPVERAGRGDGAVIRRPGSSADDAAADTDAALTDYGVPGGRYRPRQLKGIK